MLIQWAIVVIFAVSADDSGTAFVEHAREDGIAAKTDTHAARSALGQIRCVEAHNLSADCLMFRFSISEIWNGHAATKVFSSR